jgi:hypothetical protein
MAGIPCPNNDGMCYPPSTALVLFQGTYSFVSEPLLGRLIAAEDFDVSTTNITQFDGPLPSRVVHAAMSLDPALGKQLVPFSTEDRDFSKSAEQQSGDGILYTCTCGHGPFKLSIPNP